MAKKSGMGIILGVGAAVATVGVGYYLYNRNKDAAVSGILGANQFKYRYRWQFMTDGQFGAREGGMHNYTDLAVSTSFSDKLPPMEHATHHWARGNKTGHFYALSDSYAYLLLEWRHGRWVPVMA